MSRQSGFTLVEIGVIVPVVMVIAIALFSTLFAYLNSSNQEQARLSQAFTQTNALSRIEADVALSTNFLTADDSVMTGDYYEAASSGSNWSYAGTDTTHRVLLLREYATTGNPLAGVRTPVYVRASTAPDCSIAANISGQLTYNIIYFVKNSTLYKRILTDRTSPACTTQYQKESCPSTATIGSNNCGAYDETIATNVSGLSLDYYTDQSSNTIVNVYGNSALLSTTRSVNITLENTQRSYYGSVTTSSSLRAMSQNQSVGGSN